MTPCYEGGAKAKESLIWNVINRPFVGSLRHGAPYSGLGTTYSNLNITEASSVSGRYGDLFYRLFHLNSCTTIL